MTRIMVPLSAIAVALGLGMAGCAQPDAAESDAATYGAPADQQPAANDELTEPAQPPASVEPDATPPTQQPAPEMQGDPGQPGASGQQPGANDQGGSPYSFESDGAAPGADAGAAAGASGAAGGASFDTEREGAGAAGGSFDRDDAMGTPSGPEQPRGFDR